jgi:hypothetical protein
MVAALKEQAARRSRISLNKLRVDYNGIVKEAVEIESLGLSFLSAVSTRGTKFRYFLRALIALKARLLRSALPCLRIT